MKRNLLLTLIIAMSLPMLGNPIDENTAKQLAQNFWKENNIMGVKGDKVFKKRMDDARFVNVATRCGYSEFYIFNNEDGKGFVLISADDCVTPILAYSYDNNFATENLPPNLKGWLDGYAEQIRMAVEMRVTATEEIRAEWNCLRHGKNLPIKSETSIDPLITTHWNQNYPYNSQCPPDPNATGQVNGHAWAGCVATAMAQIMKFWAYPEHGTGSHSYVPEQHPEYGTQYADFSSATYQWSNMPNNSSNNAIAELLYDCGVSVEMNYGPNVSTAYLISYNGQLEYCAENALKNYFGYKSSLHGIQRSQFESTWIDTIKNELNHYRPILYSGKDPNPNENVGHAFICDGYDNYNLFHFNFGWGEDYDCWCMVDYIIPNQSSSNYCANQTAIIGIEPNSTTFNFDLVYYSTPIMSNDDYWFFDDLSVYAEVFNTGSGAFNGYIGAGVYYEEITGSNEYYFLEIMDLLNFTSNPLPSNFYWWNTYECAGGPPYIPGSYLIAMLYSLDGNYWNLIDPGSYDYAYFDIASSYTINTNSNFSILTSDGILYQNTDATINVDVLNTGSETFYGQFRISLLDSYGNWMQTVDIFDCTNGLQPNYHYTNGLDFTGLITVEPGTYLMSLDYNESGTSNWYYSGASDYQNPVWVYVAPEPVYADIYEPNNSQSLAYSFTPSFSGNSATVNTTGSNLHNSSDIDYYKINLNAGYDYIITPTLHDAFWSGNGNTYSVEAQFAYSTDGTNWSSFYWGDLASSIMIENGGTIYFDVIPYYEGDIGTYLLSIGITRTQHTNNYTISVSASPNNGGSVTGGGTYNQGASCTVHATANSGYTFVNWTENGTQVSSNANYTFTVTGNRNLIAHFQQQQQQYTISVSANPSNGGSVSGGGTFNQGASCTVHATANNGYTFVNWTENGTQVSTNANYSFTVTGNRNLVANFAQSEHTIQATAGANGIITPSGTVTVAHGANQSFAMIPDAGYEIQDVYIDGNSVGALTSYTFTNVTANHYIHVTFVHVDGVDDNNILSVVVYPNPTSGEVTIECEGLSHIRIVNTFGQTVYNADHEGNQAVIDLSQMAKGIYMMHIEANGGQMVRKIVVE